MRAVHNLIIPWRDEATSRAALRRFMDYINEAANGLGSVSLKYHRHDEFIAESADQDINNVSAYRHIIPDDFNTAVRISRIYGFTTGFEIKIDMFISSKIEEATTERFAKVQVHMLALSHTMQGVLRGDYLSIPSLDVNDTAGRVLGIDHRTLIPY